MCDTPGSLRITIVEIVVRGRGAGNFFAAPSQAPDSIDRLDRTPDRPTA